MQRTTAVKTKLPLWVKTILIVATIIFIFIAIIVYYLTGFGYTISRIRCGHKPFIKVGSFEPTQRYIGPDNHIYKYYYSNFGSKYYCTEQQAQADGLYRER